MSVTTENGKDGLQKCKVAANILNKAVAKGQQGRTFPACRVGEELRTPHIQNKCVSLNVIQGLQIGRPL